MKAKLKEDLNFYTQEESIFKDRRNNSSQIKPIKERRNRQFSESSDWYLRVSVTSGNQQA